MYCKDVQYARFVVSFHIIVSLYFVWITDADYLSFLETLKQEVEPLPSAEVYLEQQEANKQSMKGVSLSLIIIPVVIYVTKLLQFNWLMECIFH